MSDGDVLPTVSNKKVRESSAPNYGADLPARLKVRSGPYLSFPALGLPSWEPLMSILLSPSQGEEEN